MVINQTAEDFVVRDFRKPDGDLYVNAGELKNFMEDNQEGLGSAKIQLKRMLSFGEGDEDNVVFAGLYFIDKKPGILAQGLAVFSSTSSNLRFAHLFGSPYTRENGTNMAFVKGKVPLGISSMLCTAPARSGSLRRMSATRWNRGSTIREAALSASSRGSRIPKPRRDGYSKITFDKWSPVMQPI